MGVVVHSHYSEKITVSDIARASFMSRNSLFRHFQASFSKTPMEVLNDHRLSVAVSLLKEGKSMTEVSEMSGFTTPSYFNKCFHDRFGVTPGEYRKNMCKDN